LKILNRKGIDEMAVLDISASKKGLEPDFELLTDMASEAFMPLSYGGGIKTLDQVRKLLAIGYEKVVLNTSLVEDEQLVKDAVALAGSQSVVASIDAKVVNGQYKSVICDGTKVIDMSPVELAKHAEKLGVGEIFLNSIDRDGVMQGYDIDLVNQVVNAVDIPVTACGGAGGISDLKDVIENGHAHAAAGGSMFVYYGRLKAVLITAPTEEELTEAGIYSE
jgi:cyclase